jgi:hypothetical protein
MRDTSLDHYTVSSTGCWEWNKGRYTPGYGCTCDIDGKSMLAHRASWEKHVGKIPIGMEVCHSCDNPPCINPAHLFLGTHKDNMMDASMKGRCKHPEESRARGSRAGASVLTERDVEWILRESIRGASGACLASVFGVKKETVYSIFKKRNWSWYEPSDESCW